MDKFVKKFIKVIGGKPLRFHDLAMESVDSENEIIAGLRSVLQKTDLGEHFAVVRRFEKRFSSTVGTNCALGVNSGTSALYFALKVLGVGPGCEVITVANTFVSTITAIHELGAECRFVDIDEKTGIMDISQITDHVNGRTAAIVPVHMYGSMVPMDEIMKVSQRLGLVVVEDACQAIGASYRGRCAGTWGDIGCFSFHATKIVGGPGDGGMIVTDRKDLNTAMRKAVLPDWKNALSSVQIRVPSRLAPILVPILEVKLKRLNESIQLRTRQYYRYCDALQGVQGIRILRPPEGVKASHRNCIVVTPAIHHAFKLMKRSAIPIDMIYRQSTVLLDKVESSGQALPCTRKLIDHHMALPIGNHVDDALIDKVVEVLKKAAVRFNADQPT